MDKYMVIMPSGEIRWEEIRQEERMQRFYEIIGTDILENVYTILPDICIIVDDYGKLKNPPQQFNVWASLLYAGFHLGRDTIAGPAIVAAIHDVDGEPDWVPLNEEECKKLREMGLYPEEDRAMVETLFYDNNGELVESIKFYTSDAEQAGNSLIAHLFRVKIKPAKFYELAEKCPSCVMLLWTAKDNYIFIGDGILHRDGKGEPMEYNF